MANHRIKKFVCVLFYLINLLWTMFAKTVKHFTHVFDPSFWEHSFLSFLQFLCFKPHDQFAKIFALFAWLEDAAIEPKHFPSLTSEKVFSARPTVFLRVTTQSGFSITIRALLDSAASCSYIHTDLSTLLIENGANYKHIWPEVVEWPFWKQRTLIYREVSELKLQSVENESVSITTSIRIEECFKYRMENLPVDLVVEKMTSLGLPMVQSGKLGRTMWSQEDPNSQNRIDILIGQDLLNAHFNMQPLQPTYHITPSLAIIRTKMGLAFIGQFDTEKFKQWTLSATEAQKMKKALYSVNEKVANKFKMSQFQRYELNNMLTFKMSDIKRSWSEYIYFFLSLLIWIHLSCLVFIACFAGLILKCFLFITFTHRLAPVCYIYTIYLFVLTTLVITTNDLYFCPVFSFFLQWFSSNPITPGMMSYSIKPLLPLTVKSDTCTKTVMAIIDTGASGSCINAQLASELSLKPSKIVKYENNEKLEWVQIEVSKPKSKQFTQIEIQLLSISSPCPPDNIKPSLAKQIYRLLNLPVFDIIPNHSEKFLIGTNLIPSLLMPSRPFRHIALTSNLNAIETRLGYYIQGAQHTLHEKIYHNWSHCTSNGGFQEWFNQIIGFLCIILFWHVIIFKKNIEF